MKTGRPKTWFGTKSEQIKNNSLKRLYNITLEQYNQLFNRQQGCCAICYRHQSTLKHKLSIDHNHNTGKIRGLLCPDCNILVGRLEKNYLLQKINLYLSKHKK